MCRKVLSIFLMALFMLVGAELYTADTAFAKDVWAYNDGYDDHYLVAPVKHVESDNGFTCTVKIVHNGNFANLYHVRYAYGKGLIMNYYIMDRQRATWKFMGNIKNNPCIAAIYEVGRNY